MKTEKYYAQRDSIISEMQIDCSAVRIGRDRPKRSNVRNG